MLNKKVGIFIPARLASTRLPSKMLVDIGGKPMFIRVAEQAKKANLGDVIIACGDQELYNIANSHNFNAILTDPSIPTGSDRIYAAYKKSGKDYQVIINLQGDAPLIKPESIRIAYETLIKSDCDIATIATIINDERDKTDPNTVKAIISANGRALYFTRTPHSPYGVGDTYHHIGLFAYTAPALEKYINLPQSPLELRERLEQLRALENGMTIAIKVVDDHPITVDTQEDLEKIRSIIKHFA